MKLFHQFYKTALHIAVEKENIEIIKLLLTNDQIDVNTLNILKYYFIKFKIKGFNSILILIVFK